MQTFCYNIDFMVENKLLENVLQWEPYKSKQIKKRVLRIRWFYLRLTCLTKPVGTILKSVRTRDGDKLSESDTFILCCCVTSIPIFTAHVLISFCICPVLIHSALHASLELLDFSFHLSSGLITSEKHSEMWAEIQRSGVRLVSI